MKQLFVLITSRLQSEINLSILAIQVKYLLTISFIFLSSWTQAQSGNGLVYLDKEYDDYIKTVQLYPSSSLNSAQTRSPIISLRGRVNLILEFDELFNEAFSYRAKIIHCSANWQPSGLSPLQYLTEYNEFEIPEVEYSFGTITPYVHYKFIVPRPSISGNYLLVVYAAEDETDIIISRRFMVFEQWVSFSDQYEIINNAPYSLSRQPLHFSIYYSAVELINPMETITVNILQNQRWDNAKMNLRPTFIRETQRTLEYKHFTDGQAFNAGNEFRYFDIRSLKYFGFHVRTVRFGEDQIFAYVENDRPRANLAYTIEQNINGQYFIENLEQKIPDIENDYALVTFTLEAEKYAKKVYFSGKFNDWRKDNESLMAYNPATKTYSGSYILKQGLYDYQYVLGADENENMIEGDKRETNNIYEILVYYRSQKLAADLLIGYYTFVFGENR